MSEIYWGSRIYNDRFGVDFLKPSEDGFLFRGKFDATIPSNTVFGGFYDESKSYNDIKSLSINAHSAWVSSNSGKTFTKTEPTPGLSPSITFSTPGSEPGSVYRVAMETIALGANRDIAVGRYDGSIATFVPNTYSPSLSRTVHVYDVDSVSASIEGGFSIVGSPNTAASVNVLYAKKSGGHRIFQSNNAISPTRVSEPTNGRVNLLSKTYDDFNAVLDLGGTGTGSISVSPNNLVPPSGNSTNSLRASLSIGGDVGSSNTNYAGIYISMDNAVIGNQYTSSIWLKAESDVTIIFNDDTGGFMAKRDVVVTTEWERHTFTATATATTFRPISLMIRGTENTSGDVSIHMWQPQVELGPIATKHQKVDGGFVTTVGESDLSGVEFNSTNSQYLLTTYTPSLTAGEFHFISKNTTVGSDGAIFGSVISTNKFGLNINDTGGSVTITSFVGETTNSHVIPNVGNKPTVYGLSYLNDRYQVYVNGVSLGSWVYVGEIPASTIAVGAMKTVSGAESFLNGRVYGGSAISDRNLTENERDTLIGFLRNENTIYNSRHYHTVGSWKPANLFGRNLGFVYDTSNELVSTEIVGHKTPEYGETVCKLVDVHSGSIDPNNRLDGMQPSLAKQPIYVYSPSVGRRNMFSFSNRLGQAPWSLLSATSTLDTSDTLDNNEVYTIRTSGALGNSHYVRQTTIYPIYEGKNVVVSAYVKPLGTNGINSNFSIELQLNGLATNDVKKVTFDLVTETNTFASPGVTGIVSRVVGGWLRISLSYPNVPPNFDISSGVKYGYISTTNLNAHGSVKISMPQLELVSGTNSPATRYQSVVNNGYVYDQDSKSFKAIRFDNVDDCIETIIPEWLFDAKGTFFAFGTNGSLIYSVNMDNRNIVFGSSGILGVDVVQRLGDVLGYGFIDRPLNDAEILKLKYYYGNMGSGGDTLVRTNV